MLKKHCIDLVRQPEDKLIPRSLEKCGEDQSSDVTARSWSCMSMGDVTWPWK